MENIEKAVQYVLKKKEYQLEKLTHFYFTSNEDINSYISGNKSRAIIGLKLERIYNWQHWNFIYSFFKENKLDHNLLALSTYSAIESITWDYFLGTTVEQYKESISFINAIKYLAQALLLGWDSIALKLGDVLLKMLYGKQYKGWNSAYKHPWFMLSIFCKWQGIELDYTRLNFRKEMGVYEKAIQYWDTKDKTLLTEIVNELVSFHILESDEDEYKNHIPDFPSSDYFVFPIDILLWLNIRERIGLPEYIPNNELMKMPINNYNTLKIDVPKVELIEKAKMKLQTEYPNANIL